MGIGVADKTAVTVVSSTESDLQPGNVTYDEQGRKYIKCKAAGSIAVNVTVRADVAATTERGFIVPGVTTGIVNEGDSILGWNKTGQALSSGDFFWAMVGPVVPGVVSTGTIAAGAPVYAASSGAVTATAGTEKANIGTAVTAAASNLVDVLRRDG